MDPIDESWRVPSGFPEVHAEHMIGMQYAVAEMAIAVRAHVAELRQAPENTALAPENYRLAVTLTAERLVERVGHLDKAFAKLMDVSQLVGRALVRCESFDAGRRVIGSDRAND